MTRFRSILYFIWLYGFLVLVSFGYLPFSIFSRVWARRTMRSLAYASYYGLRYICNVRVVIEGREHAPKGPALIASKHQSMFDTFMPFLVLDDPAMVVKQELRDMPVFGWYMKWGKMIPVDRSAGMSALKKMAREAKAQIETGRQLVIFPEGTRQEPGAAPDYKPGVALIYRETGLPCTPVALNSGHCWPAHGIMRYPGTITVRFLPAIPAGLPRDEFMRELETRIESAMAELPPTSAAPLKHAA